MSQINDAHVARPGLAVVEVAAADDETAFAVQEMLAARAPSRRRTVRPGSSAVERASNPSGQGRDLLAEFTTHFFSGLFLSAYEAGTPRLGARMSHCSSMRTPV
jgi:hypothetical protein